jgi:hypothetical protein
MAAEQKVRVAVAGVLCGGACCAIDPQRLMAWMRV